MVLSYDAARSGALDNYWANADRFDADSANSIQIRHRLVQRSRYEVGNNGYAEGIVRTHANYLIGCGPSLRMQTDNQQYNKLVETAWADWCKAAKLRRKLWTMSHAKTQDGEAFGVVRNNPGMANAVKLDVVLYETEQCQTINLPSWVYGKIDGIDFDDFGNPTTYHFLRYHPG